MTLMTKKKDAKTRNLFNPNNATVINLNAVMANEDRATFFPSLGCHAEGFYFSLERL